MSKRKNLHQYIPEVERWDRFIDLDWRTGDWDADEAMKRAQDMPERAESGLAAACVGLMRECVRYPSCPALDAAIGVLDEAAEIGLDVESKKREMRDAWEKAREEKW